MSGSKHPPSPINVSNLLTTLRLCSVPGLLWLAWHGHSALFLYLLIGSLLTDLVDGPMARWLKQCSEFGSRYDSVADAAIYVSLTLCAFWLKPDFVRQEAVFLWTLIVCYAVPLVLSLLRFGRVPSLHTLSSKSAAVVVGLTVVLVFMDAPHWPFRVAAVLYVPVALEEIAILLILPEWRTNVPTLLQALALRRRSPSQDEPVAAFPNACDPQDNDPPQ